MIDNAILVELRFDSDTRESVDIAISALKDLDVEECDTARDPTIVAALTVAAAVTTLTVELIKLARELRNKGKVKSVVVVKLKSDNSEEVLVLLEATDDEIERFLSK